MIFKKCHWPGANVLLSVGALALAAFFVAYLFIGIKPLTTAIEKSVGVSGGIAMCLMRFILNLPPMWFMKPLR